MRMRMNKERWKWVEGREVWQVSVVMWGWHGWPARQRRNAEIAAWAFAISQPSGGWDLGMESNFRQPPTRMPPFPNSHDYHHRSSSDAKRRGSAEGDGCVQRGNRLTLFSEEAPLATGVLLRSPLARGIPATMPPFFLTGL